MNDTQPEKQKHLLDFLKSQHILTIATVGEPVWIYHAFYTINDQFEFYFASSPSTKHGEYLESNNSVAFSVSWVEDWNPKNKKGIQGMGKCEIISDIKSLRYSLGLLKKNKGMIKDLDTYKEFNKKRMYKLTPKYIKYKDDEHYSERGYVEYDF